MRRGTILISCIALVVGSASAGDAAAGAAADQDAADAAMAGFNERMSEIGGVSEGPQDTDEIEEYEVDEEFVIDDPFAECYGDVSALEPFGRFEAETARAFSDSFKFEPAGESDDDLLSFLSETFVDAGIITVDAAGVDAVDELVVALGSDDAAECVSDKALEVAEAERSDEPEDFSVDIAVTAESDLGIGDRSASLVISFSDTVGEESFGLDTFVFVARVDRSVVVVGISAATGSSVDIDGREELAAIVDSL